MSTKSNKNKLILLEEPEMNLHPNLQSQLADLLARCFQRI
ncbi:MAG: AAA family ATPase [Bacteroidetes bacterium]|nr:AAA family ATPase [Bacteroidota bacterium]